LKMETPYSCETSVSTHNPIQQQNPEDYHITMCRTAKKFQTTRRENTDCCQNIG
jgi:hypothetical protein